MRVGGFQKNSLIDYPGKVSCVIFLAGCNFDCPYCQNPDLVRGRVLCQDVPDEKTVYKFLERHKGFLDGVVISGGEPTLDRDLIPFCEKIKRIGYPLKLDTNGSQPEVIEELINENFVDYIAMDIKTDPFHYSPTVIRDYDPRSIFTSIHTIMKKAKVYEFRTTCVRSIVTERTIENIGKIIRGARLYALQRFRNGRVLHPEYFRDHQGNYNEDELIHLKSVAEPWVKECVVR